jgi:DNA-binding PadR family transcriptional regulator
VSEHVAAPVLRYMLASLERGDRLAGSTRYAVLGLLAQRSSYGYALVERLSRWPLDDTVPAPRRRSIYRAVEQLRGDRLIERQEAPLDRDPDGPSRERYVATVEGERRLELWLRTRPASFADLCLRLVAGRRQDLPTLLRAITAVEQDNLARLQGLQSPDAGSVVARGGSWEAVMAAVLQLIEEREIGRHLDLLREIREILEAVEDSEMCEAPEP